MFLAFYLSFEQLNGGIGLFGKVDMLNCPLNCLI